MFATSRRQKNLFMTGKMENCLSKVFTLKSRKDKGNGNIDAMLFKKIYSRLLGVGKVILGKK
jgi:hypothetical protein